MASKLKKNPECTHAFIILLAKCQRPQLHYAFIWHNPISLTYSIIHTYIREWQQQGLKKKILTPTKVHVNCQNNNKTKREKMKGEYSKISIPFHSLIASENRNSRHKIQMPQYNFQAGITCITYEPKLNT
jgi:hypothetical protein